MSSPTTNNLAWMNGRDMPFQDACLPLYDLGVVAGAAVTVMMRTFGHRTFRVEEHLQQLLDSAAAVGVTPQYPKEFLVDVVERLVEHNRRFVAAKDDLGVVAFVTLGTNRTYLGPTAHKEDGSIGVHTFRLPFELWRTIARDGVDLVVPQIRQVPSDSLPTHLKIRNRLHWLLADRQAESIRPGSKAILLNRDGLLTETSTANLFVVRNGTVLTPGRDVLPGMSRRLVFELANELNIRVCEVDLRPEESPEWSEAFVSSTPTCLLPVRSIGHHTFAETAGPVFQQLIAEWSRRVDVDVRRQLLDERDAADHSENSS